MRQDHDKSFLLGTVVAGILIGVGALAQDSLREDAPGGEPEAKQVRQRTPAIEVFVDVSLGLSEPQQAKKRLEDLNLTKTTFAVALEKEVGALTGDLLGVRDVTQDRFVALVDSMTTLSSSLSIAPLGVSHDRAYLEVKVFLTTRHAYVAVVTTELAGLPEEVVERLTNSRPPANE